MAGLCAHINLIFGPEFNKVARNLVNVAIKVNYGMQCRYNRNG